MWRWVGREGRSGQTWNIVRRERVGWDEGIRIAVPMKSLSKKGDWGKGAGHSSTFELPWVCRVAVTEYVLCYNNVQIF